MPTFSVGDVRAAEHCDIVEFRDLVDKDDGWELVYEKKDATIRTKSTVETSIQMIKAKTNVSELSADDLYDALIDPDYRKVWDKQMIEGFDICLVSPNTDIGYYSMRCFPPFKNRDFVTLRSWFHIENEYFILNHSVFHAAAPPRKNCVRGVSYITGFLVRKTGPNSCFFCFVTQSDPRGNFPVWAINRGSQLVAPKAMARLVKAAKSYRTWKMSNSPLLKPWLFPEQHSLPQLSWADVKSSPDFAINELDDESAMSKGDSNDFQDESSDSQFSFDGVYNSVNIVEEVKLNALD